MSEQRIVCAAIRLDGHIICGARHFDALMRVAIYLIGDCKRWYAKAEQGFIDNNGNFFDRETAHEIASKANQIIYRCGGDENTLYSENLY